MKISKVIIFLSFNTPPMFAILTKIFCKESFTPFGLPELPDVKK